ncbi:hypothetical protein C8Q74DRAFT_1373468 [Fomes fomentarius]|nr:hypothetical protein C8Q74DRAFT_1373468 [Fomes fomentarius]
MRQLLSNHNEEDSARIEGFLGWAKDKGAPAAKIPTRSGNDTSCGNPTKHLDMRMRTRTVLNDPRRVYNSIFRIWWYHHQGAIQTARIDFVRDLPRFVALLALQRFELKDWSRIPQFDLGEHGHRGVYCEARAQEVGKGTHVVESKCVADDHPLRDAPLVTKLLWVDCMRLSEGTIVQHAIAQAEKAGGKKITDHMPEVVDQYQYDEYNIGTVLAGCSTGAGALRLSHPQCTYSSIEYGLTFVTNAAEPTSNQDVVSLMFPLMPFVHPAPD